MNRHFRSIAAVAMLSLSLGGCITGSVDDPMARPATLVPDTKTGTAGAAAVKVKGTLTWLAVDDASPAEVRLYDRLFKSERPGETPQDDTPIFTVPVGHYFMMGDNRDMSADSRFDAAQGGGVGMVPAENIEGRAIVTIFSTNGSAHWLNPVSWVHAMRFDRIGHGFR